MFLIDDILMAPLNGVIWLGRRIQDAAEGELYDETRLRDALLDLQDRRWAGELSPDAFAREEERLMKLLEMAQRRKNRHE